MTSLKISCSLLFVALLFFLSPSDFHFADSSEETEASQCLNDDVSQTCDSSKPQPSFFEEAADSSAIEPTATISPTAHYTAYVLYKNGLSAPGLYTRRGWIFHLLMRPFEWFISSDILFDGDLSLERQVVNRHMMIDYLLEQKIKSGDVTQVVELACGLSSRGYRLSRKYPHVTYIETDLTSMVENKRQIFTNANMLRENHKLMVLDALHDVDYSKKLNNLLIQSSDDANDEGSSRNVTTSGTAVITEGLLSYFNREDAEKIVDNIFTFLKKKSNDSGGGGGGGFGMYLSNVNIASYYEKRIFAQFFRRFLGFFVKRKVGYPFRSDEDVLQMLRNYGATDASLHNPEDYHNTIGAGHNDGGYPRITKVKSEKSTRGLIRILEGSIL